MGKFGFSFFLDERGWSYSLEYISLSGTYLDEMGKLAKWSNIRNREKGGSWEDKKDSSCAQGLMREEYSRERCERMAKLMGGS